MIFNHMLICSSTKKPSGLSQHLQTYRGRSGCRGFITDSFRCLVNPPINSALPTQSKSKGLCRGERGGVLPYMGYIGMCHCEGYCFQAVYSGIGYINQRVRSRILVEDFSLVKGKNCTGNCHSKI